MYKKCLVMIILVCSLAYLVLPLGIQGISAEEIDQTEESTVQINLPEVVSNFSAFATDREVLLSWDAAKYASAYNIYKDGKLVDTVSGEVFVDNNPALTVIKYSIEGISKDGVSPERSLATVKPLEEVKTDLPIPTNFKAVSGSESIRLTWDYPANFKEGEVNFEVTTPEGSKFIASSNNLDLLKVNPGQKYSYSLRAVSGMRFNPSIIESGSLILVFSSFFIFFNHLVV